MVEPRGKGEPVFFPSPLHYLQGRLSANVPARGREFHTIRGKIEIMTDTPIQITDTIQLNYTVLPNDFIDGAMCKADGEYVKIYLMILRLLGSGLPVTPDILADRLNLTQKDILRAVSYWEKAGLLKPLTLQKAEDTGKAGRKEDSPVESGPDEHPVMEEFESQEDKIIPGKRTLTPKEIEESKKQTDFGRTIFMAETYLGRPFSHNELNSLCYISDQLDFSTELMEYLIEYCAGRGKKSVRYIERVAIEWYRKGITTVAAAKEESDKYVDHVFPVMKALGLSGRGPAPAELEYIRHWSQLGLPAELIVEACSRTLLAVHQPSFQYANRIIEDWHKKGVRSKRDIEELDRHHQETQSKKKQSERSAVSAGSGGRKNSFHNFDQRDYDYRKLEERLLSRRRK